MPAGGAVSRNRLVRLGAAADALLRNLLGRGDDLGDEGCPRPDAGPLHGGGAESVLQRNEGRRHLRSLPVPK